MRVIVLLPPQNIKSMVATLQFFSRYLLLACLVVWVFAAALDGDFVWDDRHYLVDDPDYRAENIIESPVFDSFFVSKNYFRPLVVFSFVAQMKLHELDAFYFHAVNVLIHLVTCLLLLFVLDKVSLKLALKSPHWVAFFCACLYSVSPLVVEPVVWVSGRFDLCFGLFSVLLAYLYLFNCSSLLPRIAIFICYLAAALSKEHAVVLPVVLFLLGVILNQAVNKQAMANEFKEHLPTFLIMFLAGVVYLGIRFGVLGYLYLSESSAVLDAGQADLGRLVIVVRSIGGYLIHSVLPFYDVSPVYTLGDPIYLEGARAIVEAVLGGGVLIMALFGAWLRVPRSFQLFLTLFLVCYFPVINLLRSNGTDNYIALRFMYFPYAVSVMCLPLLWSHVRSFLASHRVLFVLPAMFMALVVMGAKSTVPVWSLDETLWKWGYSMRNNSFMANSNLMADLVTRNQHEKAIEVGEAYLKNNPSSLGVLEGLAIAHAYSGNEEKALAIYEEIFEKMRFASSKDLSNIYGSLAVLLFKMNVADPEIENVCRAAIELNSKNRRARYLLANYLLINGADKAEAFKIFAEGIQMAPKKERNQMLEIVAVDPVWEGFNVEDY